MSVCKKCSGTIVLNSMHHKKCIICKQDFLASNIPGEVFCPICTKENPHLCDMCGEEIEK